MGDPYNILGMTNASNVEQTLMIIIFKFKKHIKNELICITKSTTAMKGLNKDKPSIIYIKLPFLNEVGFIQSEKSGKKRYFEESHGKSGKVQKKSGHLLNFLNFGNLALVQDNDLTYFFIMI